MTTVLVADNLDDALELLCAEVRKGGYSVVTARSPQEATTILNRGDVDIGVLDLKLKDDSRNDLSGLKVAKEANRRIPKIIVSNYGSFNAAREALGTNLDGLPHAVAFVKKEHVTTDLLPAIEIALKLKRMWFASAQNRISEQLYKDYEKARRSATSHYWVSLVLSIAFALPILYGAFRLHDQGSISVLFTVIGVLVAEVTNYLFALKLEFLYERVDRFHAELLQTNRFEQLMETSDRIRDEPTREEFKLHVLNSAVGQWLCHKELPVQHRNRSNQLKAIGKVESVELDSAS